MQDDNNLSGVLVVKSCDATRFARKPSRCSNVGNKLGSLLTTRLNKLGVKDANNLQIVKTTGDNTQTQFYYQVPCQKANQDTVIAQLKDACKDKDLTDTCTKENQPDDDDSSSESDEIPTKVATAKMTQKEAPSTTTAKATQKETPSTTTARVTQKEAPLTTTLKVTQKETAQSKPTSAPTAHSSKLSIVLQAISFRNKIKSIIVC